LVIGLGTELIATDMAYTADRAQFALV